MRYDPIPSGFFELNRKNLTEALEPDSIALIFAAYQMPRNGDQFFPYRQHSDFFYLSGTEQEKSILLLCNSANTEDFGQVLFILKPEPDLETWEGHKMTAEEARKMSGISQVKYLDEFDKILHSLIVKSKTVYFNLPEQAKFKPEVKSRDEDMLRQITSSYPGHKIGRLAPVLQSLRLKKSEIEISLMKIACKITNQAFQKVLRITKPGLMEYEIEAEICSEFIRRGANGHAYAPIVASGTNACTLHYITNNKKMHDGDMLLLDFGAEYANYAADLSRTIPVNGKFSKRQLELYQSTLRIFRFAKSSMIAGTSIKEIHKQVCQMAQEEHIKLGLYTQADIDSNKTGNPLFLKYFMHGTGHFLGLDVHDYGLRETTLEPGMILTCEPGIYIPEEKTGIRIENNILITETGNIDLMADIPIEPGDIEELMAG